MIVLAGQERTYIAIDLKSFYASVECIERNLDPLRTNLVVADLSRTEKTICLAVSPSLKKYGISGRARLFEVVQKVKEVNCERMQQAAGRRFLGKSYDDKALKACSELALDYIVAPPRMAHYIQYSTRIYDIYLNYIAPEDIHVYSIDEVFMDVTEYLGTYKLTAYELAEKMIQDVLQQTGITATAGMGTNLYLSKVAMDIVAKHITPNKNGVRIAQLDEENYRRYLWTHQPITDFWRVGRGYAKRLAEKGIYSMGDVARCSIGKPEDFYNEELLYKMFGINAELLIDHAWGWEPCTLADVKAYKPDSNSISMGQVLQCPYDFSKARLVVKEMVDLLALDLLDKKVVTKQLVLTIGYDKENLTDKKKTYKGELSTDYYGRKIPKHAHGTANIKQYTSSTHLLTEAVIGLYDEIVNPSLWIRRINIVANNLREENTLHEEESYEQMDLFTDYAALEQKRKTEEAERKRERKMQQTMLEVKKKFGKNAIMKGMNLEEGATTIQRNKQIGGHKA